MPELSEELFLLHQEEVELLIAINDHRRVFNVELMLSRAMTWPATWALLGVGFKDCPFELELDPYCMALKASTENPCHGFRHAKGAPMICDSLNEVSVTFLPSSRCDNRPSTAQWPCKEISQTRTCGIH